MNKRRVMLFESWDQSSIFDVIMENVSDDIEDIEDDVEEIMNDLKKSGKDVEADEVKAAIVMQAMELADEGKTLDDLDVSKVKEEVEDGMSIRGQSIEKLSESGVLSETAGAIVHIIELLGNVLGNSALMEWIAGKIEKATGKKPDMDGIAKTINGIAGVMKTTTGYPAKVIAQFFDWILGKFGLEPNMKKGLRLVGKLVVILFLFGLGAPVLGTGILWWILSLTGLVGKTFEVTEIGRELIEIIKIGGDDPEAFDKEVGVSLEELEKLVIV